MTYYLIIIGILVVVLGVLTWAIWKTGKSVTLVNNSEKDKEKK